jgi:hypothetical protein
MFGSVLVKTSCAIAIVGSLLVACGPAASLNKNEGGSCTTADDCGGDLDCQPIQGRQGDFCCPTPPTSSSHPNCQPGTGS